MQRHGRARRLLQFLGIDRAVGFALAGQIWRGASGPLLLLLLVGRLTLRERGVMFNYMAITEFQFLFELGIGTVIQQLASRERAFLAPNADGTLGGDPAAKARLAALFRIGISWFVGVAIIGNAVLLPAGWIMFSRSPGIQGVAWELGWVLTILAAAGVGVALSVLLFLSGCGFVASVARIQALKDAVATLALAASLLLGAGLVAHPISSASGLAVMLAWVVMSKRRLVRDLWRCARTDAGFRWRTHVWPLQWRVSISWMCVMVVIWILHPMTMLFQGAAAAGQVGLSMIVLMTIQGAGGGWLGTKVPSFGMLAAQKNWVELDRVFRAVLGRSLALVAGLSLLFVLGVAALHSWDGSWAQRTAGSTFVRGLVDRFSELVVGTSDSAPLVPPLALALLTLAILSVHVLFAESQYLRAHGREPMVPVALALAVAVVATLLLTGAYGTVQAMIAGYAFWLVALGLGGGTYVFVKMRRRWHADKPLAA